MCQAVIRLHQVAIGHRIKPARECVHVQLQFQSHHIRPKARLKNRYQLATSTGI